MVNRKNVQKSTLKNIPILTRIGVTVRCQKNVRRSSYKKIPPPYLDRQYLCVWYSKEHNSMCLCAKNTKGNMQCCGSGFESGSGSTCFWVSWIRIRIHQSEVWIRIRIWILLSPSKISKKNFYSYCFVTSFWLFLFENDAHVPSKSNKQK